MCTGWGGGRKKKETRKSAKVKEIREKKREEDREKLKPRREKQQMRILSDGKTERVWSHK